MFTKTVLSLPFWRDCTEAIRGKFGFEKSIEDYFKASSKTFTSSQPYRSNYRNDIPLLHDKPMSTFLLLSKDKNTYLFLPHNLFLRIITI